MLKLADTYPEIIQVVAFPHSPIFQGHISILPGFLKEIVQFDVLLTEPRACRRSPVVIFIFRCSHMNNNKFFPIIHRDETALLTCRRTTRGFEREMMEVAVLPAECILDCCMQPLEGPRGGNGECPRNDRVTRTDELDFERVDTNGHFWCVAIKFQLFSPCGA
ncbi:hypothetical protein BDR05DRAFT_579263 [Suillus weaverae]|nr:hypothetical protein BDR05DRAFT_579263 [Suillus weaverae]